MDYSVNVSTAGSYTINLRVATPNFGAQLQIRNSGGTVLATVNLPVTGGFQTWQTISAVVNLGAGTQTIRLQSSASAGWNINWLEIVGGTTPSNQPPTVNAGTDKSITLPTNSVSLTGSATDADGTIASYAWSKISGGSATITSPSNASTTITGLVQGSYTFRLTATDNKGAIASDDVLVTVNAAPGNTTKIEAENYTAMSGIVKETTTDAGGGQNVGYIDPADWMEYTYAAPSSGSYTVNLRVATPSTGAQLQIRKTDGTVLATVNIPNTGGFQTWQTISTTITLTQGTQTLRVVSTGGQWKGWNFNWMEIIASGNAAITGRRATMLTAPEVVTTQSFDIFPNPARDRFTLAVNNSYAGKMEVHILNMIGAVQKQFSLSKASGASVSSLHIGDLPKGQYILLVEMNGHKETKKFIKQ
jgi:hypothetical protein